MLQNTKKLFLLAAVLSMANCSARSDLAVIDDRTNIVYSKNGPMEIVRVHSGDSITTIAKRHNVPVEIIAAANNLPYPYNVNTHTILIPRTRYYKTHSGDTIEKIAQRYSVNVEQLMDINNVSNKTMRLKTGTIIQIPDTFAKPSSSPSKNISTNYDVIEVEEIPNDSADSEETTTIDFEKDLKQTLGINHTNEVNEFSISTPLGLPQFMWPLSGNVMRNTEGNKKDGITIYAALDTPVRAAGSGKVIFAENDNGEYGNLIIIKHSNGYLTAYAHNNQLLVRKGDEANRGQAIAKVGKSGKVKEPQLYFSMRRGKELINPEKYEN